MVVQILMVATVFMLATFHGVLMIWPLRLCLVSKGRLWKPRWYMTEKVADPGVLGL